ncbi:MAG: aminoacyl-tRNA hydrolase [Planctomycetes bacterium RBG_16_55_9]|nr:MAG: aminoacyl-tRNA hydrolase [Planctomycetes bacterium RBG_16_55_9]
MKLVAGLGNPGGDYAETRHNIGFRVIDLLARRLDIEVGKRKFGARFGLGEFAGKKLIVLKPWQFMNRSGQAVATAVGFYRLSVADVLVVTDDMDLDLGKIRIRARGSAGGHNGLADVIEKLGTNEFARCRVGIGRSLERDAVDFVLDRPAEAEKPRLDAAVEKARDAVLCWIEYGIETAMNQYNRLSD